MLFAQHNPFSLLTTKTFKIVRYDKTEEDFSR